MAVLLRELIDIPERVHEGDFVLNLSSGVIDADKTLGTYVVTPQLMRCFDEALGFVQGAVERRTSKATYLHGSFGSGKSHFMAVLHLLLAQHPKARAIPGLASVVAKHNTWTEGKRFLLVPYHMIGASSMEAAVLGGYARHVRKLHPDAPVPAVYLGESLFADARRMREAMGDADFFAALGGGGRDGDGGWGDLAAGWDAESFEAAIAAPAGDERRTRLVSDLVGRFFQSYAAVASSAGEGFLPLDAGLAVVSQHAAKLGYDAVILFLDELILWLASHAADVGFVTREGQKLVKLIESGEADRPIPLVSFVARQRDLRELVGAHVTGAVQLNFADVLRHWEGRFHVITLEDRNLPEIASKRLLEPKSEAAKQQIDQAFRETERIRDEVLAILLTDEGTKAIFRKVYPFSPALIETLVAVSSVLQRERTALRVMLQLLVEQRDTLALGEIIPVGDLFDVIAHGNDPFTEGMRVHFENARRLWAVKLLPLLEAQHKLRNDERLGLPANDPRRAAFEGDARLLKTLVLAALVPEVRVLKGLNPPRLAALNHGSIRVPIKGQEGAEVLRRCRAWAAQVGELRIADDGANPTIALQLAGVDTESIIQNGKHFDNVGNRRRKVRELLFQQLGIPGGDELFYSHEFTWRGVTRSIDVIFSNVRTLGDESFATRDDVRKAVIDFPFDPEEHHTPNDDLARLEQFRATGATSRTIVWLPSFLSDAAMKDLALLVVLDELFLGERFDQCAAHLSVTDRNAARVILDNQRSQLRQHTLHCLEGAYGVAPPPAGMVDESHGLAEHFQCLDPTWTPQPPVGANLRVAFEQLLGQQLLAQYPDHPQLGVRELKAADVRRVWEQVQNALQAPDGRIAVEKPMRATMSAIAVPLELGEMGETHFVLGHVWKQRFEREANRDGGEITVTKLRSWTDLPRPRGLPTILQNLLILTFAEQTDRSFFLHGGAVTPSLDKIDDALALRTQVLPTKADWQIATERAQAIFGFVTSPLLNGANASRLASELIEAAAQHRQGAGELVRQLVARTTALNLNLDGSARLGTAREVQALLETVAANGADGAVTALGRQPLTRVGATLGTSFKKIGEVLRELDGHAWETLEAVARLTDERAPAARALGVQVREAIGADEIAVALGPKLKDLHSSALRLLAPPQPRPKPGEPLVDRGAEPQPKVEIVDTGTRRARGAEARQVLTGLADRIDTEPALELEITWTLRRTEPSK